MPLSLELDESAQPFSQCAESKIYLCSFYGTPAICKHRFEKRYRHPKLDAKMREQRTVREARAMARCRRHGIRTPTVFAVDKAACKIFMERIEGATVKDVLDREEKATRAGAQRGGGNPSAVAASVRAGDPAPAPSPLVRKLLKGIGEMVGKLHNADVIHGDLTTSNFLYMHSPEESEGGDEKERTTAITSASGPVPRASPAAAAAHDGLVVIDFGLVADKNSAEERAVDLYVLERALLSTHPFVEAYAADLIYEGYRCVMEKKKLDTTLARLEVVRARGRKRSMVG